MKTELAYQPPPTHRRTQWPVLAFVVAAHCLMLWFLWHTKPVKIDTDMPALSFVNLSGTSGNGSRTDSVSPEPPAASPQPPQPTHRRAEPPVKPTPRTTDQTPHIKPVVTRQQTADLPKVPPAETRPTQPKAAPPTTPAHAAEKRADSNAHAANSAHTGSGSGSGTGSGASGKSGSDNSSIVVPAEYQGGFLKALRVNYPPESIVQNEQGKVVVKVTVAADGTPTEVSVSKGSGYSNLDRAARQAVRNYRFKPATRGGVPIPYTYHFTISFSIN